MVKKRESDLVSVAKIPMGLDPVPLAKKLPDTAYQNPQLDLFQTVLGNTEEQRGKLSNALDLWDSVPRYMTSRQADENEYVENNLTFHYRGEVYTRTVWPTQVTGEDGTKRFCYPGASEELVEEALRKMAIERKAGFHDVPNERSGVSFTLYALREELGRRKHTRSYQQIVQSLNILSRCTIEIRREGGGKGEHITSSYLPSLAAVSQTMFRDDPQAKWVVQFHPLVTQGINELAYRQFNYSLLMSHKGQLARWIHRYLILKYTWADPRNFFEIRYSTIKRDSGMLDGFSRGRDAVNAVVVALAELKDHEVLTDYKRSDEVGPNRKLLDVVFTLRPHVSFANEATAANRRLADAKAKRR